MCLVTGPAREPARARAGQQLHWQVVLRDIPRRAFGGYRHRHLSVPALLLAGTKDFAVSPRSLTGTGTHAGQLAVRVIGGAGHYLPKSGPASSRPRSASWPPMNRPLRRCRRLDHRRDRELR